MEKKRFFITLVISLLVGFSSSPVIAIYQNQNSLKSNSHILKQIDNRTVVEYGDYREGYYDITSREDIGFPETPFTLEEGKYAIHDNSSGWLSTMGKVNFDTVSETIKFTMPFVIPGLNTSGRNNSIIRYGIKSEDLWSIVNTIGDNGSGQPNWSVFEVKGKNIDDVKDEDVDITDKIEYKGGAVMDSPDGLRHSVDGATFGFKADSNDSFYNYTQIHIQLTDSSFTKSFNNYQGIPEPYIFIENVVTEPGTDACGSVYPSDHVTINDMEEVDDYFPSVPVWYEAAKSVTSRGSFKNKETAINEIAELIKADVASHREQHSADYTDHIFSENNTFEYQEERTYTDYTEENYPNFNEVEPYDVLDFSHGTKYDIDVVPFYENTTEDPNFRHKITKVYAFKHNDSKIDDFIRAQAAKFVEERNALDHLKPAYPFLDDENENVIFDDYRFYRCTSEDEGIPSYAYCSSYDPYDPNYSYIGANDSEMTTGHMKIDPEETGFLDFYNQNGFYSLQYGWIAKTNVFTKDFVLVHTNTSEEWQKVAKASGDPVFVNLYNNLYVGESGDEYIINSAYDNKITFSSADAMFIRITKDNNAPEYHTAYATYSIDGANPASLIEKKDYVLDMNSPGTYKIEFMNRTDTEPVSLSMRVIGDEGFGLNSQGSNLNLRLSVINGSSKDLKQLTIRRSKLYSGHLDSQTYIENMVEPVEPSVLYEQGFGDPLEYDESATPKKIEPTTLNYEFIETGATRDNQFNECFYIEAQLLNSYKFFYLYWNYEIPEYEVTVNVGEKGSFTGSTSYKEGEKTNITITPNEGYKITEVYWNGTIYPSSKINPTGMKIEEVVNENSTLNVNFTDITYYNFKAEYNEKFGSVSYKDKYGEFETTNIEIEPKAGYLIDSIKWNGGDIRPDDPSRMVINRTLTSDTTMVVTFREMKDPVTLTIDQNDGGTVSGGGTFEKETKVTISITVNEGYEIESIYLGEQSLEIKTSFEIILEEDATLKVRFKKIVQPVHDNTGLIVGICCGVGAVAIGVGAFLIVRAKKIGSMKK